MGPVLRDCQAVCLKTGARACGSVYVHRSKCTGAALVIARLEHVSLSIVARLEQVSLSIVARLEQVSLSIVARLEQVSLSIGIAANWHQDMPMLRHQHHIVLERDVINKVRAVDIMFTLTITGHVLHKQNSLPTVFRHNLLCDGSIDGRERLLAQGPWRALWPQVLGQAWGPLQGTPGPWWGQGSPCLVCRVVHILGRCHGTKGILSRLSTS
jgi:hypothetical protein